MTEIVVIARLVPDLVEELEIAPSGTALDLAWLRLIINELDNHAIEQAIILKEKFGANVTIISPEAEGVDDMLFTTAAKGADRLIKLTGLDEENKPTNKSLAQTLASLIKEINPNLVLTGVQAHDDLTGDLGSQLAEYLQMPYVGYIAGVSLEGALAKAFKEYPGGLLAEMEVTLPAVLGIQASEEPPRYVAISKVRQMMSTASIDEETAEALDTEGEFVIDRMYLPEATEKAEMLEGSEEEIATKLSSILKDLGLL
jgi:electron transfer flavoprotein beta subunit